MNDLRFAIRQLLKNPGFTAMAVLTLALAITAAKDVQKDRGRVGNNFGPPTPGSSDMVGLSFLFVSNFNAYETKSTSTHQGDRFPRIRPSR